MTKICRSTMMLLLMFATTTSNAFQISSTSSAVGVASRSGSTTRRLSALPSHHRSTSSLSYRNGDEDADMMSMSYAIPQQKQSQSLQSKPVVISSWQLRWWNSINLLKPKQPLDETSQKVDEYLEFLDKRYHRLHQKEENTETGKRGAFSALGWLAQGSSATSSSNANTASSVETQDNALYALGVAGLASQRLLQKHHWNVPSKQQQSHNSDGAIETSSVVVSDDDEDSSRAPLSLAIAAFVARLTPMAARWQQLQQQVLSKRQLLRTLPAVLVRAPHVLMRMGGGRRNVALASSAVVALLLCVVRPLAHLLVRTAAASQA